MESRDDSDVFICAVGDDSGVYEAVWHGEVDDADVAFWDIVGL